MRIIEEKNGLPKRVNFKLLTFFNEFLRMNIQVASVNLDEHDYSSIEVAYSVLNNAAHRHHVPVKVKRRNGLIYLVRTDM